MKTDFKILSFSDVHLGCKRLDQNELCGMLQDILFCHIPEVRFVTICGDLFDDRIILSNNGAVYIVEFLTNFLYMCDKFGVTVRVLLGTYEHDRNQCQILKHLANSMNLKMNIEYFDKVDIEYIESLDLRIGYIPDSLPYKSSDEAIDVLKSKMTALGYDHLDYVLMHGYAEHVLPPAAHPKIVFRVEQFPFVKKCILAGHVHQHSSYKNFYYHGSIDRLAFNEEDRKGFLIVDNFKDTYKVTFVENREAHIFKTFDYTNYDDNILDKYKQDLSHLLTIDDKKMIYVRVVHKDVNIRRALKLFTENHYPFVKFFHVTSKTKDEIVTESISVDRDIELKNYSILTLSNDINEYLLQHKIDTLSVSEIDSLISEFL